MTSSGSTDGINLGVAPKKARRPIKRLGDENPALLEVPVAYLKLYAQEFEASKCMKRSPPLQYCLRQCFLGFQDVCRMIDKRTLKAVILRESLMNLVSLANSIGKSYPDTAETVCVHLVKLIVTLEEVDRQLAAASNLPRANWTKVVSSLKTIANARMRAASRCEPGSSYVPPLKNFTVTKTLGRGAFGSVYQGVFRETLKVAIKIVPQNKLRFDVNNESAYIDKMLASVIPNHPFICRMYCAFKASGKTNPSEVAVSVTVMEAVDGADIAELANRAKSLNFQTIMSIMQQLLMAVEHMHLVGFIHRDIKPANILLSRDGRVKVIDFDVNKLCIALSGPRHQVSFFARTATEFAQGEKAGTEAYMAPEVHKYEAFGRASDWWSVGIVFFRLTFGKLPFRGQAVGDEIVNSSIEWDRIRRYPAEAPIDDSLKAFISQLLLKDPRKRLGSKNYNDIFGHVLFAETDWSSLPEEISLTDDMVTFFAAKDEETKIAAKAVPANDRTFNFEDLVDYTGKHQELLTYSSRLVRHLMTDFQRAEKNVDEERDIKDDPVSFRHCQQLTEIAEDTTRGLTTTDDRKKIREPVQVIVQELNRTKCFRRIPPIEVQRLLCEDGMYRFTVERIAPGVKFLSEARLFYGDVLMDIDKIPLTGLPLARIKTLLCKTGSPLVVTVVQKNPFRDIEEGTFRMENYENIHKPSFLRFRSLQRQRLFCFRSRYYHGFELTVTKASRKSNSDVLCLVSHHDLVWQNCGSDSNTFTGDIVLAINQKRLHDILPAPSPRALLSKMLDTSKVDLEFLPSSSLRVENLPRGDLFSR